MFLLVNRDWPIFIRRGFISVQDIFQVNSGVIRMAINYPYLWKINGLFSKKGSPL